ncbi:MAG: hydantoinase B/oxoprolinase family protein, partial [Cyanobacteria bacterium P01_C01_bin.70]
MVESSNNQWQFWIDRGGTFTDVVAKRPDGEIVIHKLLSENPEQYRDAPVQGIRDVMGIAAGEPIPAAAIGVIKMGTTVATNALLEKQGDRTVLAITQGFRDALKIGYQNRPDIFAREIVVPTPLYERVIEAEERYSARGEELIPVNIQQVRRDLQAAYDAGIRSCAIALMHGYRYPEHEQAIADIARKIGFTQVSASHQVSPLIKLVSRGDTTVVDAYLSPTLKRYVDQVVASLTADRDAALPKLMFMQSNGGLADAQRFQGKDSILSGPAGGIVGAVKTSQIAGFDKIISFDMGGTSTDVAHYRGDYERSFETEVAGVRLRTPMMSIHTVAAGGGSVIQFDGARYRVGPQSAGAHPGPACYGKNGPLTITDCNVMVGKLQPDFFPKVFGPNADAPLDAAVVQAKFQQLTAEIGDDRAPEDVASGFLAIAVEKMAGAIKKISLQRGYDISKYTLCCFGGAGGQHACLIADALGIQQIMIHPYAGVLSAYGIGLADIRVLREKSIEIGLATTMLPQVEQQLAALITEGKAELDRQAASAIDQLEVLRKVHLKYVGTDSALLVDFADVPSMRQQFETLHQQRYGFIIENKALVVDTVSVELICPTQTPPEVRTDCSNPAPPQAIATVSLYTAKAWHDAPVYQRADLQPGNALSGPAIVIEDTGTNIIEPGWRATVSDRRHLILEKPATSSIDMGISARTVSQTTASDRPDPVMLEVFNNLFRSIAEQMGTTLQNTSYSVNIKERLDFSCAIFDQNGHLVANAPHIPVHLGSMSDSVRSLINAYGETLNSGDVYILNNPYNGGTHLPDVTVITPVFLNKEPSTHPATPPSSSHLPAFYVASRGHHADIGGITPGSMPSNSTSVEEEGVLIDNFKLVESGQFREQEMAVVLTSGPYPVRNITQNMADLQAQIAANEKGVQELRRMSDEFGLDTVQAYMKHIQDNAEAAVRQAINALQDGRFTVQLDTEGEIRVAIAIDRQSRSATIDFTGTSGQLDNNFNAPAAICRAAVLYVFRTLVDDDIPLNEGCLKPLKIIIPEG